MANANTSEGLKCMNCGAPIKTGFFCQKCQSGENDDAKSKDGWTGSRFSGDAKRKRQRQMLMDDLATWGKRLLILAVLGGIGYGGWTMFGPQIKSAINGAKTATESKPKYDPTKDAAANEDDQAGAGNGHRAFAPGQNPHPHPRPGNSIDDAP